MQSVVICGNLWLTMAFSHRLTLIYADWGFYAYLSERLKMSLAILFEVNAGFPGVSGGCHNILKRG
ncbi:MAG: hypothetical protein C5S48_07375 [Candidatus Methanogaster sp.]|nr:MAG: hypothetical protein C5S48_07375 [ANME-2 cluster archaeon]